MKIEVVDRNGRHVQPKRRPGRAGIERHENAGLRARKYQTWARRIRDRHRRRRSVDASRGACRLSRMLTRRQARDFGDGEVARRGPRCARVKTDLDAGRADAGDAAGIGGIDPAARFSGQRPIAGICQRRPRVAAVDRFPRAAVGRRDRVHARHAGDALDRCDRAAVKRPGASPGQIRIERGRNTRALGAEWPTAASGRENNGAEQRECTPHSYLLPPRPVVAGAATVAGANVQDACTFIADGAIFIAGLPAFVN